MRLFAPRLPFLGGTAFGFGGERGSRWGCVRIDFGAALFALEAGNFVTEALDFLGLGAELPGLLIDQI